MAVNPNNFKASPIPVVPRTMRIVNPDGTPTRSGQLLLEQLQTAIAQAGGGGDGTGGGPDATGPVTGFTVAHEVGTRYASEPDRLVHMTVGFIPIVPVPQSVTYLISADDGATWVWIGSQRMLTVGQELHVDRLAPGDDSMWRVAAIAGNLGGDPSPLLNSDLETLYPGVVRSTDFPVAGLSTPPASTGITATIGTCSNVVSADGFTQYGVIPGVVYTDPIGGTDFFVRLTVQDLDSSHNPILGEQAYGGTQITGGSHTEKALLITYIPSLAYIRYRFYTANRNSQGGGDFSDHSTNTLQMVKFNGNPTLADHYDVPVVIPPFTPIDPGETFNVLSVSASEVGPKYQDVKAGLHTTVGVIPVIDHDYSSPRTVTIWFDFGDGVQVWQGWYALTSAGQVVRIGDSTLGTDGTRRSGDIWVPANAAQGNWTVWCGPGRIDKGVSPTGYATFAFTVVPVTSCLPNGTTQCQFVNDPTSGNPIIYSLWDPGIWYWEYYELTWLPPSIAQDPNFWFSMITVQKGATISGTWTPAPDSEGINADPNLNFLGRVHDQILQLPGLANDQVSTMRKFGARPATWVIPPAQNPDMSTNVYRDFRFLMYNVSRLGTDTSGSGGAGTYTLQTSCWPGGTDHFILTPVPKTGSLDIRAANPATITAPLTGGNGLPLTVEPGAIGSAYLADDSVQARHMATDAITAANGALAAGAVVDVKVHDVSINKVTYGVSVFAGDVVLSRGIGLPVIVLQNAGIYLFGQADASTGTTGLTSKPYTVVQSGGIGLFQGGTGTASNGGPGTGGSIFLSATSSAITIYQTNGDLTKPYFTVSSAGLSMVNGVNSFAVTSNAMVFLDTGNSNRIDINSAGITLTHGLKPDGTPAASATQLVVLPGGLQFTLAGVAQVTINSGNLILSNGGAASVTITAGTVSIVNGSLVAVTSQGTVSISNSTAGVEVVNGSNVTHLGSTVVSIYSGTSPAIGSEMSPTTLLVGRFSALAIGLNSTNGSMIIGSKTVIDANQLWREGVQCTDHIIGNDFGVSGVGFGWPQTSTSSSNPGGPGPGAAQGTVFSFVTGAGKTVYVCGGLIVNVV